jgi:hypothetical protein
MTKVGLKVFTKCRDLAHELPVVAMEASQRGLKNHECRQLLERLQEQGWLRLQRQDNVTILAEPPVSGRA